MKNKVLSENKKDSYIKQLEEETEVLTNQLNRCNRPVYCVDCKNYINNDCKLKHKCNFNDPTYPKLLLDRPYYHLKPYNKLLKEKDFEIKKLKALSNKKNNLY